MKRAWVIIAMGWWLGGCAGSGERAATQPVAVVVSKVPVNKYCPVVPTELIDPGITYDYNGKTYGFCCSDCIVEFKKNPAKYAANAK